MKLIYIEWMDCGSRPGWMSLDEAKTWAKERGFYISECGFLLEETKEYILFATSYSPKDSWDGEMINTPTKIPTTWIRKRVDLTKYIKNPPATRQG